jgi:hypothetical protein
MVPFAGAAGQAQGLADEAAGRRDAARDNFSVAAAQVLGRNRRDIQIDPPQGVATSALHDGLRTGELFAWTALDRSGRIVLRGFAGAGHGAPVAMEGYKSPGGGPGGIAALLKAANVLGTKPSIPPAGLAARVAFCLNRQSLGEFLYEPRIARASGFAPPEQVQAPTLIRTGAGRELIYFTMVQGRTGTFDYWRISARVLPGYRTHIRRERLRP